MDGGTGEHVAVVSQEGPAAGPVGVLDRLAAVGITRAVLALGLVWIMAFAPFVHHLFAAGAPRMALTGALVDDRDIKIDGYPVAMDRTERDGHVYSDKALGQQILAVPVYSAARVVGAEPSVVLRPLGNLTLWWVTLWSSGLPFLALLLMAAVATTRQGTPIPTPALAGLLFGTMLLPFSVTLYGHVLAAALGFGAWLVLDGDGRPRSRAAIAGALVGLAVLVEYQMAILVLVLAAVLVLARRWRDAAVFAATLVPYGAVMAVYHQAAYGSPFRTGYGNKPTIEGASLIITGWPSFATAWSFLFGSRGMLLFTPIVAIALVGLVQRWRRSHDRSAAVALAVIVGFGLLQAGWPNPWGGETPGPRYLIPALPFLALGLADIWDRVPVLIRSMALAVSMAVMTSTSVTWHLMASGSILGHYHLQRLLAEGPEPTLFTMAMGTWGWVPHLVGVALAIGWVVVRHRHERQRAVPAPDPPMVPEPCATAN